MLDEVYDAVHVEGDDGFFAFVGFQEGEAEGGIHESILGKNAGGVGVLEDVEGGFQLGPGLELFLPVVVGVHVGEDQNPELLSKKQDTLNVKKNGGRKPYNRFCLSNENSYLWFSKN